MVLYEIRGAPRPNWRFDFSHLPLPTKPAANIYANTSPPKMYYFRAVAVPHKNDPHSSRLFGSLDDARITPEDYERQRLRPLRSQYRQSTKGQGSIDYTFNLVPANDPIILVVGIFSLFHHDRHELQGMMPIETLEIIDRWASDVGITPQVDLGLLGWGHPGGLADKMWHVSTMVEAATIVSVPFAAAHAEAIVKLGQDLAALVNQNYFSVDGYPVATGPSQLRTVWQPRQ